MMLPKISYSNNKPLYLQICNLLCEDINSGKLAPGSRVWSEHHIMDQFKVSRNTAQKAIEILVHEGMVVRVQGKGSFVTHPKVAYGLQRLLSFSEETLMKGLKPSSKVISLEKEHPNLMISNNLKISEDDWIYKLVRLRMADEQPIAYQISNVPEKLCPDIDRFDFTTQSLFAVIEEHYNLVFSWQELVIKPISASRKVAKLLGVLPKTPLLLTDSVTYLDEGTPIESSQNIYLSERYEFTVHSSRQQSL